MLGGGRMEPSVIITPDTPEKYRPLAAEIVPPLLALLRERSAFSYRKSVPSGTAR